MTNIFVIILIIVLPFFFISLFRKQIKISWPWLWENIGKHFITYYLITTDNKLVKIYFYTVITICTGNPFLRWLLSISIENKVGTNSINIEIINNNIDKISVLIIILLTIVIVIKLVISYKLKQTSSMVKDKTLIVLYGAKIVEDNPLLNYNSARQAIPSNFQPSDGSPFRIQMNGNLNCKEDWKRESQYLKDEIEQKLFPFLRTAGVNHISLFGIAPMPLLVKLGTLLNEMYSVEVYQKHRNPDNWYMLGEQTDSFIVNRPNDQTKLPVLVLSLSDSIIERIIRHYDNKASIWEVTVQNPNMDMMRTKKQLEEYKTIIRDLLNEISRISNYSSINVHMAIPISCAIELGRVWKPKPHKSLILFDYRKNKENETITIEDK